jgi:hypothetical protein
MDDGTRWSGAQLGNITLDMAPEWAGSTCCSIATSFSSMRSQNSTDGVPFQMTIVGPPENPSHVGQFSYNCAVFDYGAELIDDVNMGLNASTGQTPELLPFPPPPPPCSGFTSRDECFSQAGYRCWWGENTGCGEQPPIKCGSNGEKPPNDGEAVPLCFHIGTNLTVDRGPWRLLGTDGTIHATVLDAPPLTFSTDAYFSVDDGQVYYPSPGLDPFQFCAQYVNEADNATEIAVCVKLTSVYDATWGLTPNSGLTVAANWINGPFVINYVLEDDAPSATRTQTTTDSSAKQQAPFVLSPVLN